jgi:hypothetical protein
LHSREDTFTATQPLGNKKIKMKNIIIMSAIILGSAVSLSAQTEKETHLKKDMQNLDKREAAIKKEKQEVRKELRKLEGSEVSSDAKLHFDTDFLATTDARWERTAHFDEVAYTKDGQMSKAYYDTDTKLVGTTSNRTFTDLPAKAQKTIGRRYRSYKPGDVLLFHDNEFNRSNMVLYNQQFTDDNNYFVEMESENKRIVLRVNMEGDVFYFTQTK